jgi:hypothetical protein
VSASPSLKRFYEVCTGPGIWVLLQDSSEQSGIAFGVRSVTIGGPDAILTVEPTDLSMLSDPAWRPDPSDSSQKNRMTVSNFLALLDAGRLKQFVPASSVD